MKRSAILFILLLLIVISCSEGKDWEIAKEEGTIKALRTFIQEHPDDKNNESALQMIDSIDNTLWLEAKKTNTVDSYEKYISNDENGSFIDEAKKEISTLNKKLKENEDWQIAKTSDTKDSYSDFINNYPESEFKDEAEAALLKFNLPDIKYGISDFFICLSKSDYAGCLDFFSDTVLLYVIGNDYERENMFTGRLNEKILSDYGYWNVTGELIFKTFTDGTYFYDGDNTCKIHQDKNILYVDFVYNNNGAGGNFDLVWKKENGTWKITKSQITLPNFM